MAWIVKTVPPATKWAAEAWEWEIKERELCNQVAGVQ